MSLDCANALQPGQPEKNSVSKKKNGENIIQIKKKATLPFATKWMKLEEVILCEISQMQKENISLFRVHLYVESKKVKHKERIELWLGAGEEKWEDVGQRVQQIFSYK